MKTLKCTGGCKRTGISQAEAPTGSCPYCLGRLVDEETGRSAIKDDRTHEASSNTIVDITEAFTKLIKG